MTVWQGGGQRRKKKDWQKKRKGGCQRAYKQILTVEREEHPPHFAQQHKSTCPSGHFHHARWKNLL